jgi:hypothetical protein
VLNDLVEIVQALKAIIRKNKEKFEQKLEKNKD